MPSLQQTRRNLVSTAGEPVVVHAIEVGMSAEFHPVADFARVWSIYVKHADGTKHLNTTGAKNTLTALGVPLLDMPDGKCYFNTAALEAALVLVSRFGGPGFFAPGSEGKRNGSYRRGYHQKALTQVTPEAIEKYGKNLREEMESTAAIRRGRIRKRMLKAAAQAGRDLTKPPDKEGGA